MVDACSCLNFIPVSPPVSSLFSFLLGRDAAGELMLSLLHLLQGVESLDSTPVNLSRGLNLQLGFRSIREVVGLAGHLDFSPFAASNRAADVIFGGLAERRYIAILGVLMMATRMTEQDILCPCLLSRHLPLVHPHLLNRADEGGHYCHFGVVMGTEIGCCHISFSS